jgi:hypothetical protein
MADPRIVRVEIIGSDEGKTIVDLGPEPTQREIDEFRSAYNLGLAWAEAEAALPEKGRMIGVRMLPGDAGWMAEAQTNPFATPYREYRDHGLTPAAALRALAAKLRERAG